VEPLREGGAVTHPPVLTRMITAIARKQAACGGLFAGLQAQSENCCSLELLDVRSRNFETQFCHADLIYRGNMAQPLLR